MSDYTIKPEQELPEKADIVGSDEVRLVGGTTGTSYLAKASTLASYFVSYLESVTSWRLKIYPIGAIYMSMNSTDPGELFGGTWEQIKDVFLVAEGDSGDDLFALKADNDISANSVKVYMWKRIG